MMEKSDLLAELRVSVERLQASLPSSVDVAALGVKSKAPYELLCTREALIWRTEELARNASEALERSDFAAAAILARAVTENAAMTWTLMSLLEKHGRYTPEALHDRLMRLLAGSMWPEAPKPVHVNDLLREMEKAIPGVAASYDSLSEIVHPNWSGVVGLFSKTDRELFITHFGRGLHSTTPTRERISNVLLGSLDVFEYAYNRISALMPTFLAGLEPIWPESAAR